MNKVLGVALAVALSIAGLAIWLHGNARNAEGKADCVATQANTQIEKTNEARKDLENAQREAQKIKTDDLDNALSGLAIMRDDADR